MHYKLPGYLDMKQWRFSQYYNTITSAAVGMQQAKIYTSILGIYVCSKRKRFWLMIKMQ